MALESGDYIGDLDPANPVTATDPVTQGADHLRLLKRALRQSFPAFVGTQAAPKTVDLSEDQINDAALKSETNTFTGSNAFTGSSAFNGGADQFKLLDDSDGRLNFFTSDGITRRGFIRQTATAFEWRSEVNGCQLQIAGNDDGGSVRTMIAANPNGGVSQYMIGTEVTRTVTRANGSLQIADSAGAFGNVAAVHKEQTFAKQQTFAERAHFTLGTQVPNNVTYRAVDNSGNSRSVVSINPSNQCVFSSAAINTRYEAVGNHRFYIGEELVAEAVARSAGSLLVFNSRGEAKKAGFRNPRLTQISGNGSAVQNWEGEIIEATGAITITLVALEANTTFRIINVGNDPITITGSAVAIERFLGGSSVIGTFTLAPKSVIECWYRTGTSIRVFGNGTS